MNPLRLCPNASIPSDVVSRCTWPGQGSRTSRTANTMSCGGGVKGHTRSGADDESRTRGLDHPMTHGVVALCLLSYIRKNCKTNPSASTEVASRQVVKERPPSPAVRFIDRWSAPRRRPVEFRNEKARILSNPGLCEQSLEGARLHAALSRMHPVLVPIKLPATKRRRDESAAHRIDLVQGGVARAQRRHRRPAPGTNATGPFMGRLVLVACLDFTMRLFEESCAR